MGWVNSTTDRTQFGVPSRLKKQPVTTELDVKYLVKSSEKHLQKLRWGQPLLEAARESREGLEAANGGPVFGRCATSVGDARGRQMIQALFSPAIRKIAKKMRQGRQNFMEERLSRHARGRRADEEALASLKTSASALALSVAEAIRAKESGMLTLKKGHHKLLEARDETALAAAKRLVAATIPHPGPPPPSLSHAKGAMVYYGSAIALQAHHGGYLGLGGRHIDARATQPTRSCLFTLWNLIDLGDIGAVRYGDRVWLQCSRYEVLGTSAMPHDVGAEWTSVVNDVAEASRGTCDGSGQRLSGPDWEVHAASFEKERIIARLAAERLAEGPIAQPAGGRVRETVGRLVAVPCGGSNAVGAQALGRWVILNRTEPHTAVGTCVMHQDCVVLQQEELYISSRKKETCDLRVPRTDVSGVASALEKLNKFERLTNDHQFGEPVVVPGKCSLKFFDKVRVNTATASKAGTLALGGGEVLGSPEDGTSSLVEMFDKEFCFMLHIVKLPASSLDEQKRMESAMHATIQLTQSKNRSLQQVPALMRMRLDQRLDAKEVERSLLERTLNERGMLEAHMKEQYCWRARKGWTNANAHHPVGAYIPTNTAVSSELLPVPTITPVETISQRRESLRSFQPLAEQRVRAAKEKALAILAQTYKRSVRQSAVMLDAFMFGSPMQGELMRRTNALHTIQRWCKHYIACKWARKMAKLDYECTRNLSVGKRPENAHTIDLETRSPILSDFFLTVIPSPSTASQSTYKNSNARPSRLSTTSSASKLRRSVGVAVAIAHTQSHPLNLQPPQIGPPPTKYDHLNVTAQCSDSVRNNYPKLDEEISLEAQETLLVIFRKERYLAKRKMEHKVTAKKNSP